jgi:hypothetical protein
LLFCTIATTTPTAAAVACSRRAPMPTLNPPNSARARIATARARCEQLQGEIRTVRHTKHTGGLPCARSAACRPALCADIEPRRELLGHSNKVLACCWSSDSRRIASTSQDGHLVVWDGVTTAKLDVIKLVSPFTLVCSRPGPRPAAPEEQPALY